MKTERTYAVLKQVAAQNNVAVEEVIHQIDAAIAEAMASPDPSVRETWVQLFGENRTPSATELIARLAGLLNDR